MTDALIMPPPFLRPEPMLDERIELRLRTCLDYPHARWAPTYCFAIRPRDEPDREAGRIELRIGADRMLTHYAGHVGYGVHPPFRGRRYAASACRLLFPLAAAHRLDPLWITCDPDNHASRRTCELAGGVLVEILEVPPDTEIYRAGSVRKCRYRFDLTPEPPPPGD